MHTTNYYDTFIAVAEDTAADGPAEPPVRATPSIAEATYRMIAGAPYTHTSDDVIFTVCADRKGVPESERQASREQFFSKGQPCLRSSDLGKRYGWGVHADADGRVALIPLGSAEYDALAAGEAPDGRAVTVTRAMRSSRAG